MLEERQKTNKNYNKTSYNKILPKEVYIPSDDKVKDKKRVK